MSDFNTGYEIAQRLLTMEQRLIQLESIIKQMISQPQDQPKEDARR